MFHSTSRNDTATSKRRQLAELARGAAQGYLLAPLGVAGATAAIGVILSSTRLSNVSLLYLPVVLWLAARYGRGPAILASLLSFLSYDFFFIPPEHLFTVDNPTEWLSLFALLATSLVLGHLTAIVRTRAREAEESQRRTDILYRLAQLISTSANESELYEALTRQVVEVFAPSGVRACALLLPDELGSLQITTFWSEQDHDACEVNPPAASKDQHTIVRAPLKTPRGVVGALLISGAPSVRQLTPDQAPAASDAASASPRAGAERQVAQQSAQQAALFAAFCDQIALAIDRATLAREAMHTAALRESDRLKDALLGSVTHELRTPLASIKAATSGLLQDDISWSAQERGELLESIDTSADRLNRLVGNLLDLSRLEAGVAEPELDWRLVSDVVAATLDQLDLGGQLRGHVIRVDEPADLPLVLMDQEQIQQVLTNLIENALKYSPDGSEIRIAARVRDEWLEVSVSDQGIGIPQQEIGAIFNKFYRVQQARLPWSAGRPPIGTGLGLAICEAIVRAHGGRIWAESEPGHGATLTFTLPISSERPQGELPEVAALNGAAAFESTQPAHPAHGPQEARV